MRNAVRFAAVLLMLGACEIRSSGQADDDEPRSTCGDGVLEGNEICDDGNTLDGDGCNAGCSSDETCGNGVLDAAETCDDGNLRDGDGCTADCLSDESCGNGVVDTGVSETCDDSNQQDGDGCSASCRFEPRVYLVTDDTRLVNQSAVCSATTRYDGVCDGSLGTGFSWDDTSPFTPSMIQVELANGVNCVQGSEALSATLNNTSVGTMGTIPGTCSCTPVAQLNSHTFANPGNYAVNGTNTFLLSPSASCFGFTTTAFGAWARITVFP